MEGVIRQSLKRKLKLSSFPIESSKPNNLRSDFGTDENASFLDKQLAAMSRKNTIYNKFATDQNLDLGQSDPPAVACSLARQSQAVVDNVYSLHKDGLDKAMN